MTRIEISWKPPLFRGYSILNAVHPAICWQRPRNHPLVRSYDVQMLREDEDRWVGLGQTEQAFAYVEAAEYDIRSAYQIRIATIGVNGRRSGWSYSSRYIASPLRFDFTTASTVRMPSGENERNQRLLFLLF
jgi:hypothetical protein